MSQPIHDASSHHQSPTWAFSTLSLTSPRNYPARYLPCTFTHLAQFLAFHLHAVMSATNTSRTRDKVSGRYASKHKPGTRRCHLCSTGETSQWRTAPDGNSLCNKCGIKLRRGTLHAAGPKPKLPPISSIVNGMSSSSSSRTRQVCSIRNIINPN